MSFQSDIRATSPPSSSPPGSQNSRKRVGDDENSSSAPKPKRRLLGRTLGAELQEISPNTVSNTINQRQDAETTEKSSHGHSLNLTSLPTPPAEQTNDASLARHESARYDHALSTSGKRVYLSGKQQNSRTSYEQLIAERSEKAEAGKPQKHYYGINIHELLAQAEAEAKVASINKAAKSSETTPEPVVPSIEGGKSRKRMGMMWTEKYRAKKFTDLCGDERTHRQVLKWLKAWDPIVFPGAAKPKPMFRNGRDDQDEQSHHRKILLLTGPPGLGKTTLAHVCAKQAGYECVEVNASDERSSSVVKNRIRDCLGTENVRGVNVKVDGSKGTRRPGKPVCVVLDEVDGVTGSSGASDGGFMKALVDLVLLDQRNSKKGDGASYTQRSGRKGDSFRLLRPLILVCNDVYASALRPLRSSGVAEIIHVRKPPLDKVIERTRFIFDREGVACDDDAVRRLCEHTWGVSNRRESKANRSSGDGDMRSVLVTAEWAATKLRSNASNGAAPRLTKQWIDTHIIKGSFDNGNRGLGRGGAREAADRIFMENAGFGKRGTGDVSQQSKASVKQFIVPGGPKPATDTARSEPIRQLRECIDTADEHDRVMTEVFTAWPTYTFQDDTILSKPNAAYEWLDFHDQISSRIFGGGGGNSSGQEWELKPYHSTPALGFHYLFGNGSRQQPQHQPHAGGRFGQQDSDGRQTGREGDESELLADSLPFSGPRASYDAYEVYKETRAILTSLQASEEFNIELKRMFQRPEDLAVDLLPHLTRMLAPAVKPVTVGGGRDTMATASVRRDVERSMVARSVHAMAAVGVSFERYRVEDQRAGHAGFVFRMEPPLDSASAYESLDSSSSSTTTTSNTPSTTIIAAPSSSSTTTRYAVRQLMHQEHEKYMLQCATEARRARGRLGTSDATDDPDSKEAAAAAATAKGPITGNDLPAAAKVKRDFFGRIIPQTKTGTAAAADGAGGAESAGTRAGEKGDGGAGKGKIKVWATFNEGFSNAVRKPISLKELMDGL